MKQLEDQIAQYEKLDIPQTKQPDFDAVWSEAVNRCESVDLNVQGDAIDYPLPGVTCRDLTFEGLDGTPIHTWLLLPPGATADSPVPAVVSYHGAGGDRGIPADFAGWLMNGLAVISPDFRMQNGDTGSNTGFSGNVNHGWYTLGIRDLKNSYLYCVWTDGLRAVRLARETEEIDSNRIAVMGGSQGGGMALGIAALDRSVQLCLADVPSNCWLDQRLFARAGGVNGVSFYLREYPERLDETRQALSYFDNINHAPSITAPTLVSVGLKDPVCPPDCAYAAFNKITAEKEMVTYPFGEHGGGGRKHFHRKIEFVRQRFGL